MAEFIVVKSKKHEGSKLFINLNHVEQIYIRATGGIGVMINGEMFVFDDDEIGGEHQRLRIQMYLEERLFHLNARL